MEHHPDAFSRTLESSHRQRNSLSRNARQHHDGAVNRLSRLYEQADSAKPALPVKPPSLRTSSYFSGSPAPPHLPSGSQPPVSTPPRQSPPKDDSGIDQTSLAFEDIRARFQQGTQPRQIPSVATSSRRLKPRQENALPTRLERPTPLRTNPLLTSQTLDPPSLAVQVDSSRTPKTLPRPGSFTSELQQKLEQEHRTTATFTTPPTPTTATVTTATIATTTTTITTPTTHTTPITSTLTPAPNARPSPPPPPPPPSRRPQSFNSKHTSQSSQPSLSSPSLHIPAITRTATGNSTTSASSQSSSLATADTPSKRSWGYNAISHWFSGQEQPSTQPSLKDSITIVSGGSVTSDTDLPPSRHSSSSFQVSLPVSPQLSGKDELSKQARRAKVIQELIDTERVYQSDMRVLKTVFYDKAVSSSAMTKADVKILFSNLLAILEMEDQFVARLTSNEDAIGLIFCQMMNTIDQVYCEYCKRYEDAVIRLQELESQPETRAFLQQCQAALQDKTTSWDLGSLLIKPVQRVLKYPLLLRELFMATPKDHADYKDIEDANFEIQNVADHINEIKRRKDIVEKIVGDKKKTEINVVHGLNKKITRRAQRLKQVTGFSAEATHDSLFDSLHSRFESQKEMAHQLAKDIQAWVRQLKSHFETLREFTQSFEVLYASWGGVRVRSMQSIQGLNKAVSDVATCLTRELDVHLHGYVYSQLEDFLHTFDNPGQVINKRAQKLLDYDRVRDIKSRGDTPDKALQESAQAYESINAQLVEELPRFLELTGAYFGIVLSNLAMVQSRFYQQMAGEWQKLVDQHCHDRSLGNILGRYAEAMLPAERLASQITILNPSEWDTIPGLLPTPSDDNDSIRSMSSGSFLEDIPKRTPSAASFHFATRRPPHSSNSSSSDVWS